MPAKISLYPVSIRSPTKLSFPARLQLLTCNVTPGIWRRAVHVSFSGSPGFRSPKLFIVSFPFLYSVFFAEALDPFLAAEIPNPPRSHPPFPPPASPVTSPLPSEPNDARFERNGLTLGHLSPVLGGAVTLPSPLPHPRRSPRFESISTLLLLYLA